jgi:hypothetical protein
MYFKYAIISSSYSNLSKIDSLIQFSGALISPLILGYSAGLNSDTSFFDGLLNQLPISLISVVSNTMNQALTSDQVAYTLVYDYHQRRLGLSDEHLDEELQRISEFSKKFNSEVTITKNDMLKKSLRGLALTSSISFFVGYFLGQNQRLTGQSPLEQLTNVMNTTNDISMYLANVF